MFLKYRHVGKAIGLCVRSIAFYLVLCVPLTGTASEHYWNIWNEEDLHEALEGLTDESFQDLVVALRTTIEVTRPLPVIDNGRSLFIVSDASGDGEIPKIVSLLPDTGINNFLKVKGLAVVGIISDRADDVSGFGSGIDDQYFLGNLLIEGFDVILDAENTIVIVDGLDGNCDAKCIRVANAPFYMDHTKLACGDHCFWGEIDAGPVPSDCDLGDLIPGFVDDSNQRPMWVLKIIAELENTCEQYDVALTNSHIQSNQTAMAVINLDRDAPPPSVLIENSHLFTNNSSNEALLSKNTGDDNLVGDNLLVVNSVLSKTANGETVDFDFSGVTIVNSLIYGGNKGLDMTGGRVGMGSSAISFSSDTPISACDLSFRGDGIDSLNYNIVADETCPLDGMDDLQNTDPGLRLEEGAFFPVFDVNSPAIDGGPWGLQVISVGSDELAGVAGDAGAWRLPCSPTDMRGLPRPQDGNGDGIAECDVGPVELQVGDEIGAPQTGALYDTGRSGEGIFVEMLAGGKAIVYLFSYRPDGSQFWALGLGEVRGNGIVIPRSAFKTTMGAVFGEDFDPDDVIRIPFADMSVSLPDCSNPAIQGVLNIGANADMGFPPLLSRMKVVARVLSCKNKQAGPGFTGSLYDKTHSGEGIIVQVVSATRAVVIWFTYDQFGNQYWVVGTGTIDGNTITVTDAYSQTGPAYGPDYDADDIVRTTWGDFSLEFNDKCDQATLRYKSRIGAFGSGTQDLGRLTNPLGVTCGP